MKKVCWFCLASTLFLLIQGTSQGRRDDPPITLGDMQLTLDQVDLLIHLYITGNDGMTTDEAFAHEQIDPAEILICGCTVPGGYCGGWSQIIQDGPANTFRVNLTVNNFALGDGIIYGPGHASASCRVTVGNHFGSGGVNLGPAKAAATCVLSLPATMDVELYEGVNAVETSSMGFLETTWSLHPRNHTIIRRTFVQVSDLNSGLQPPVDLENASGGTFFSFKFMNTGDAEEIGASASVVCAGNLYETTNVNLSPTLWFAAHVP